MQHGPVSEHAVMHGLGHAQLDIQVSVVLSNAFERGLNFRSRTLKQLKVNVMTADKRPGYTVPSVASPSIQQDAIEHGIVIPEGLRGIDDLDKVRDGVSSCKGHAGPDRASAQLATG